MVMQDTLIMPSIIRALRLFNLISLLSHPAVACRPQLLCAARAIHEARISESNDLSSKGRTRAALAAFEEIDE
jgi:hypothetical protein